MRSVQGCLWTLTASSSWALEAGLHWAGEAADMWYLHTYTLWSQPLQSATGMKLCQMQRALSSQRHKLRFEALKNWKIFPQLSCWEQSSEYTGKGCVCLAPKLRFGLVRGCSRALLRWACPKPECNKSKASCFTSLATLNKLISHSTANKL